LAGRRTTKEKVKRERERDLISPPTHFETNQTETKDNCKLVEFGSFAASANDKNLWFKVSEVRLVPFSVWQ